MSFFYNISESHNKFKLLKNKHGLENFAFLVNNFKIVTTLNTKLNMKKIFVCV